MNIESIQTTVADALSAAFPGIPVFVDDGNQRKAIEEVVNVGGQALVVHPLSVLSMSASTDASSFDTKATFSVALHTNPQAIIRATSPVSNPQALIAPIMTAVCAVGKGPAGRPVRPHPERSVIDSPESETTGLWTYLFTFVTSHVMKP